MDLKILEEAGLTEGERKVYQALILLGKSSTGPLIKESGVSNSNIYIILDRLIDKGLASYVVENNVKKYSPTDPGNVLDYIHKKKENIERIENKAKDVVEEIKQELGSFEQETAQIYKGFKSLRSAFEALLDGLEGTGKDMLFFTLSPDTYTDRVKFFMDRINKKSADKGVFSRGISPLQFKEEFKPVNQDRELYELRFIEIRELPYATVIGNERTLMTAWDDENPMGVEHVSSRLTKRHRDFFDTLWDQAEAPE